MSAIMNMNKMTNNGLADFLDDSSDVSSDATEHDAPTRDARDEYFDLEKQINDAYEQLRIERTRLHDANAVVNVSQAAYDDCKRDMLINGHVIGKNAEEREARLADLLRVQTEQLRDAQGQERTTRLYFEIARDEVERLRLLVQIMANS